MLDGGEVQKAIIHGPPDPSVLLLDRDQWAGPGTVSRLYHVLLLPGINLLLQGLLHRRVQWSRVLSLRDRALRQLDLKLQDVSLSIVVLMQTQAAEVLHKHIYQSILDVRPVLDQLHLAERQILSNKLLLLPPGPSGPLLIVRQVLYILLTGWTSPPCSGIQFMYDSCR